MSASSPASDPSRWPNPYVGPRPFERDDEGKLFGRDDETRELLAIITATPITLLYAQSGAGKTSLIKARLLPMLERRPCEVYGPLRVASPDPPKSNVKNLYTYNALASMCDPNAKLPSRLGSLTLTDYLAKLPKPEAPRGAIRMPRVVIFDQFEDLFTRYSERWQDRAEFFEDVNAALAADPRLRIVFGMREEYLATFESYAADLPPSTISRFRLERLRRNAAAEAIEKPLESTNVRFKPKALGKLLDNLTALPKAAGARTKYEEFAEAVQLQIVCLNLWKDLPRQQEQERVEIDSDAVKKFGDVEEALRGYYDVCIKEITEELGTVHRFHAGKLRTWFERSFINDEGQRSMVYKGTAMTAGFPNEVIAALEKRYLIRSEPRGATTWCELSHERFIKPILESNRQWRREADVGNRAGSLETQASQWSKEGKPARLLLAGTELRRAQEWMAAEAANIGASPTLEDYVAKSAARHQDRSTRRLRLMVLLTTLLVLIIGGIAMWSAGVNRNQMALLKGQKALLNDQDALRRRDRDTQAFLRAREREIGKNSLATAMNEVAGRMLNEERPLDALSWSIRAVKTSSSLPEPIATLRRALGITSSSAAWLRRPGKPIVEASFSPDGRLALTRAASEVCLWDLIAGTVPKCRRPEEKGYSWNSARFSRDGGFVIAEREEPYGGHFATVWYDDGSPISGRVDHPVSGSPWLLDGCGKKNLLVLGTDLLEIYDTRTGVRLSSAEIVDRNHGAVAGDCNAIVTMTDQAGKAMLWSPRLIHREIPHPGAAGTKPSFDDTGRWVFMPFTIEKDSYYRLYDVKNSRELETVHLQNTARDMRIVGGTWVVARGGDGTFLDYYAIETGKKVASIQIDGDQITENGEAMIGVTRSGEGSIIESIDLPTRRKTRVTIPEVGFASISVSRDGRFVMTQQNGVVRVWDLHSAPPKLDGLTTEQLLDRSCKQLSRFGYDGDVRNLCAPRNN